MKNGTIAQETTGTETDSGATSTFNIGIDEHLGEKIDMSLQFTDEDGEPITLAEAADGRPILLTFVYYRCPGICSPLLSGVAESVAKMNLQGGKDFKVVTVSFSPEDEPWMAKEKKANYLYSVNNRIPPEAWRFLIGTPENIRAVTSAAGFKYQVAEDGTNEWTDYIHTGVVIAVAPDGTISRYLLPSGKGNSASPYSFLPFDFKMALMEAQSGRTGPTISRVLQFCFSYDPKGRTYTFNILRVAGIVCLTSLLFFGSFVYITTKSFRKKYLAEAAAKARESGQPPREVTHHG